MNILTIDTSTRVEIISVKSGGQYADMSSIVNISHSATLFVSIEKAFNRLDLSVNNIDLIGVGIGPGSFTGIRIAVSTARMLAQVVNAPLVGIKTPHFFASSVEAENGENILVCFDAKKEKVFGALYKKGNNLVPDELMEPGDYHIDDLIGNVDNGRRTYIIGDAAEKYFDTNIKYKIHEPVIMKDFIPSGIISCEVAHYLYNMYPVSVSDYTKVHPFYSRKSDAEILKKTGGVR
ncbi:MAG: tRNA (adenosine(37)-N6)-threonylcarbamoyltransferase complex dimerization subunit type 1 TsaB [Spirochaetes bacterium]|nr:tRNA (adenosine(37)-N6)-threonylcarbamoyltransferase complex dimerization subunit type 1 TsaB [Spirochaetota bacterium]